MPKADCKPVSYTHLQLINEEKIQDDCNATGQYAADGLPDRKTEKHGFMELLNIFWDFDFQIFTS